MKSFSACLSSLVKFYALSSDIFWKGQGDQLVSSRAVGLFISVSTCSRWRFFSSLVQLYATPLGKNLKPNAGILIESNANEWGVR